MQRGHLPAPHHVTIPTEDLRKTANDHVRVMEHMHVQKVAYGLIDHNGEIVAIGKSSEATNIRGF